MRRVMCVFGTRPEAIKLAPVVRALRAQSDLFQCRVCVTAQHREMLDQVLSLFEIDADYDLDIMTPDQTLAGIMARAVERLDRVFCIEKPDIVLVQGDTTTVLCAALVAYYHRIKVGHVEAGLRTGNKYAPFPEEMNRRLVSQLTDFHFAPTENARDRLLAEGHARDSIVVTGNTVVDALVWVRDFVRRSPPNLPEEVRKVLSDRRVILVTGHRRESFGAGFDRICRAIRDVVERYPDVAVVYPVHLNPNVQKPVREILGGLERVVLIQPLSYECFVWLMDRAHLVLTDSGGVQEEAPSLGKPVLVMREITERPEGLACGNARLVGTSRERILQECGRLLDDPEHYEKMSTACNPYGDGRAAQRILAVLRRDI